MSFLLQLGELLVESCKGRSQRPRDMRPMASKEKRSINWSNIWMTDERLLYFQDLRRSSNIDILPIWMAFVFFFLMLT